MPLTFRDLKGSNLTPAEADDNIRTLEAGIAGAQQALQEAVLTLQPDLGILDRDDLLLTVDQRLTYPPRNPMLGLNAIDVTVRGNVKVVAEDTTLSWITPFFSNGQTWDLELSNASETPVTVTLPEVYSTQKQALVTSFVLPAGGRSDLFFRYDGERVRMSGEPLELSASSGIVTAPATTSIVLSESVRTVYQPLTISGPVTINVSGTALGAVAEMAVLPNGTDVPTVAGAEPWDSDAGFLNTLNVPNLITAWHNGVGSYYAWSRPAVAAAAEPPLELPGPVTTLAAGTPTDTTIPLTWNLPNTGGGSITDYIVQYALAGTSFASPTTVADGTSVALSAVVTGLAPETSYDVRVAPVNGAGTGPYASVLGVTTAPADAGGGGTAGTPVTFASTANLTSLGDEIYEATSAGTSNTAVGVVQGIAAGDCFIEVQFPAATTTSSMLGLDAGPQQSRPYGQCDFLVQLGSTGTVTQAQNSTTMSATLTTLSPSATTRVGIRRVGSTLTVETTTDDWATSTVRHTFSTTTSAPLSANFFTTYSTTPRRLCQPRVTGFA